MASRRSRALLILARYPRTGVVKTRLIGQLEPEDARQVAEAMLLDTVSRFCGLSSHRLVVVAAQGDTAADFESLFAREGLPTRRIEIVVGVGDMEADIEAGFAYALRNSSRVVMTTADMPYVSVREIETMFRLLRDHDVVFYPNVDGGACPRGMRQHFNLFFNRSVRTPDYIGEFTNQIRAQALRYKMLPMLFDIDRPDDLRVFYHWQSMLADGERNAKYCSRTMAVLRRLFV